MQDSEKPLKKQGLRHAYTHILKYILEHSHALENTDQFPNAYTHACITHDSKKSGSTPQRIQNTQTRIQHEIFICFMLLDFRKEINPEQPSKFKRFFFGRKSGTQGLRNAENVQTLKLINQASTIWEVWDHLIFGVFCSSCALKVESHGGASCKMLYTTAVSNTS